MVVGDLGKMIAFLSPVEHKGMRIPLDKAIVFIGRHPECDVVLTRSRKVSRKHCAVAQVNNSFVIRDLGSMNGIRVNGRSVRKDLRLQVGDDILIGDLRYVLAVEKAPEPERRLHREHAEDARAAGSTRRPETDAPLIPDDISREVPVVIPEFEAFNDDSVSEDTPHSEFNVEIVEGEPEDD